jgi:hypothetical protein
MSVRIGLSGAVAAAAGKAGPALLPDPVASGATTHKPLLRAKRFGAVRRLPSRNAPTLFSAHPQR